MLGGVGAAGRDARGYPIGVGSEHIPVLCDANRSANEVPPLRKELGIVFEVS